MNRPKDRLYLISACSCSIDALKELQKQYSFSFLELAEVTVLYRALDQSQSLTQEDILAHYKINKSIFKNGTTIPFQLSLLDLAEKQLHEILGKKEESLALQLEAAKGQCEFTILLPIAAPTSELFGEEQSEAKAYLSKKYQKHGAEIESEKTIAQAKNLLKDEGELGFRIVDKSLKIYLKTSISVNKDHIEQLLEGSDAIPKEYKILGPDPLFFHSPDLRVSQE